MQLVYPLAFVTYAASALVTGWLSRRFQNTRLMDIPVARSSHTKARPKGGGLAILAAWCACGAALHAGDVFSPPVFLAFVGLGAVIGAAGFLDDLRLVSLWFRLAVQALAGGAAMALLGGAPRLELGPLTLDLGWGQQILGLLFIVWMTTLFNFMDGIDGLAASEAMIVLIGAAALAAFNGLDDAAVALGLIGACAAAGFLVWNIGPSQMFMGSVGSEFLGFLIALLAIYVGHQDSALFWSVLILAGAFVSDATATLTARMAARHSVFHAHKTHAYQYLARHMGTHNRATAVYAAISLFWLGPWAMLCAGRAVAPLVAVIAALAPLFAGVTVYRAWRGSVERAAAHVA